MNLQFAPYSSPLLMANGHIQTILPAIMRKPDFQWATRTVLPTDDGDQLLLDWGNSNSKRLVIISHGLEGHSQRAYVRGMAKVFTQQNWQTLGWNYRSCGGEMNLLPRSYHNGSSDDLQRVIEYALELGYQQIALVGFSMGGNITLNYLAEHKVVPEILGAAVFAVPTHLRSSVIELAKGANAIYMKRFLKDLHEKLIEKEKRWPELISTSNYDEVQTFFEFDERYTAPLHGFSSAEHYWASCSTKEKLKYINTPCLLANALDDPFLGEQSYVSPQEAGKLVVLNPKRGGHVGWCRWRLNQPLWTEQTALSFIAQL